MKVMESLKERLSHGRVHMTLIDPASQDDEKSVQIAVEAEKAGTDFIMLGGSTEIDSAKMDRAVKAIKSKVSTGIILFPGSSAMISRYADAIYFMSLLNSKDREYIIGHQRKASMLLREMGMETISMAYLVFEPGMTVGRQGKADLIGREDWKKALSYALAAEMMGMDLVYLEAGSGSPTTISPSVVSKLKETLRIPVIAGGGIRSAASASELLRAGADIIVTGTIAEKSSNVLTELRPIVEAVHSFPSTHD